MNRAHQAAVITKAICMAVCIVMPKGLTSTTARHAMKGTQLPM